MYAIIFNNFHLPDDNFFQEVSDGLRVSFSTHVPYCIVLTGLLVEYVDDILCFFKLKRKEIVPSIDFKLNKRKRSPMVNLWKY